MAQGMSTPQDVMQAMIRQRQDQEYEAMRQQMFQRNMAYANPLWQQQMTQLSPEQEQAFLQWVQANKVPFNPGDAYPDYDMRGFYTALQSGDPRASAAINPATQSLHYPDYWKTPYHESFSNESRWATEGAPSWQDNKLISSKGEVVFEDKPEEE